MTCHRTLIANARAERLRNPSDPAAGRMYALQACAVAKAELEDVARNPFDKTTELPLWGAWDYFAHTILGVRRPDQAAGEHGSPAYAELIGGGA